MMGVKEADRGNLGKHFFCVDKKVAEIDLHNKLEQMYDLEFTKYQTKVKSDIDADGLSVQDCKFLEIVRKETSFENG